MSPALRADDDGRKRVYIDGVFDMLNVGHIQALEDAVKTVREGELVVGVVGDDDATAYKRKPIIDETTPYHIVETDEFDAIDYECLRECVSMQTHACIVICNIGTTMTSGVDDPSKIRRILDETGLPCFIHCDAALAGMLITPEDERILQTCDSLSMSFPKFLGAPMPCGIVLCKRAVAKGDFIDYLHSIDTTIGGSRNGFMPLHVWRTLARHGASGLRRLATENLAQAQDALQLFRDHGVQAQLQLTTIVFAKPSSEVVKKWQLACTDTLAHVVIMPSTSLSTIRELLGELLISP